MNLAILLLAIVTVHQASCASYPVTFLNGVLKRSVAEKRQISDQQIQCISERFAEEFHDSAIGSQCALVENQVPDITMLQVAINEAQEIFCTPECGNTLLQIIYRECGTFDEFPGFYDHVIGLCATNSNGDRCYEHAVAGHIDLITTETRALKCKTLGGIHMQSTAAMHTSVVYILRMRVRVPRCPE